jgi:nucleotide-binding universal stress UspA family protein
MASHGHGEVKRLTVGSVAAGIVHRAHCPVIVIRAQEEAPPAPLLSRDPLLVPMDGSPFAEEALSVAREALGTPKLTLHLLRVVETSKWYMNGYESLDYGSLEAYQAFEEYRDWAREDAAQYLERIAADLATEGHEVSWQVEQGVAVRQIVEVADERNVGMIVMATHGRAGLTRLLLGSVSEQVLHESRRPLMLIRPQQACAEPE